jgi:tungstate transport system ATP-binding protein
VTSLSFEKVVKAFGKRTILADVTISLVPGECQLLCGENGAGKSTLLRILAGMERPDKGLLIAGDARRSWRRAKKRLLADCIYLHQRPYLFEGSVRYNLNYPLSGKRAVRDSLVSRGLEWSGLSSLAEQSVHQLSGGERQRVALARAWLRRPSVMLLDEPTANMDVACRQRTVELLRALKHEGLALLVATHDPLHFADIADRTLRLAQGRLTVDSSAYADLPESVTPINRKARFTA